MTTEARSGAGSARRPVLLISDIFPPRTGGSGRWLWEVYRRLPPEQVVIAAGRASGDEAFDRGHDLRVERVPLTLSDWSLASAAGRRGYREATAAVRALLERHRVGAIHAARCLPEGWIAWWLGLRTGLPYACYVHGEELAIAASSRQLTWMARRVYAGAGRIIANSENTARLLRGRWLRDGGQLHVVHPGVDTTRFCPAPRDPAVRAALGWGQRPVVLTVGRLQRRKGHDVMIQAIALLRNRCPDLLYAIVGDGEERARLEAMTGELGVGDHVRFHGEVSDQELVRCYQQCDLFVLPNREVEGDFEGFGMVLVEAQACGRPVLAGDSGGTAETMRVGETGVVVDCGAAPALADAVARLLAAPERLHEMGVAARAWVLGHYDWGSVAKEAGRRLGLAVTADPDGRSPAS